MMQTSIFGAAHSSITHSMQPLVICMDATQDGHTAGCRFWEHHWVWWTAPFLGAFLAAKLYAKYVMPKDQLKELRDQVAAA